MRGGEKEEERGVPRGRDGGRGGGVGGGGDLIGPCDTEGVR